MSAPLTPVQLTGRDPSHLVDIGGGHRLVAPAARALLRLQEDALAAGFELAVASSYRDFQRQLDIFNAKARGERPVHDDRGAPLDLAAMTPDLRLWAILRFSALPGTSRHHWGTDLDVYDAAAVAADYRVELSPREVYPPGPFAPLHDWLDARMAAGLSHGFFRPYARDRGGVAPERWHLSYAPLAARCAGVLTPGLLRECWGEALELREIVEANLEEILARYVEVPPGWCPA